MIRSHFKNRRTGFTIVELMIGLLLVSMLTLMLSKYLKGQQSTLRDSDLKLGNVRSGLEVKKFLMDDLMSVAPGFPSCSTNPASSFISGACSSLKVRAAITPLPSATKEDVDALTNFAPTSALTQTASTLSKATDSIRLVLMNISGSFNCKLNPRHTSSANPSQTAGSGAGAERLWAHPQCAGLLSVGSLYILSEQIGSTIYSNVFQVTALTTVTLPDSSQEIQVDMASSSSSYNQTGGLGLAGFSSNARIYPIKLVEYAVGANGGLYRREIIPTASNLTGYGTWSILDARVETMQFTYVLGGDTSRFVHSRSIEFTADTSDNGIEDIIAVTPDLVIKASQTSASNAEQVDNPHTSNVENDSYPRSELTFYLSLRN